MALFDRLEQLKQNTQVEIEKNDKPKQTDMYRGIKERAHHEVIRILDKRNVEQNTESVVKGVIEEVLEVIAEDVNRPERAKIGIDLYNDVMGYGPLESFLSDPEITEIMVNGPDDIFVERYGKIEQTKVTFRDTDHLLNIIDRIVSSVGRHIDEATPMVDARLTDGSRVNVIIPPLSLIGPVITIRKFSKIPLTSQDLLEFGSCSLKMLHFLEACVKGRLNIIVSGGTGSG